MLYNLLLLLFVQSILASLKHPLAGFPGDDVFMSQPYEIISMEIKCQSNSSAPAGQNVAIDIANSRIAKFRETERLITKELVTQFVADNFYELKHRLYGVHLVNPLTSECVFVNWMLMIEEKDNCRYVHAILRNVLETKEDIEVTLAWMNHIATGPMAWIKQIGMGSLLFAATSWTGAYFPNFDNLKAFDIDEPILRFLIKEDIRIEPVNYDSLQMELQNLQNLTTKISGWEFQKRLARIKNSLLVNFDDHYAVLVNKIITHELTLYGLMPYSENLLDYITKGWFTHLNIDHAHGKWPRHFFERLINLIETDSFDGIYRASFGLSTPAPFAYFYVNMGCDRSNAVPWPNTSRFKLVEITTEQQGIKTVKYVWKRPGMEPWIMLLSTDGLKSFNRFIIYTDE